MNWSSTDKGLHAQLSFKSFSHAVTFLNAIVDDCNAMNHHPDIHLHSYNLIDCYIITHEEGKITDKDFTLASKIAGHYKCFKQEK